MLFQFKCQRQPLRKIAIGKVPMGFCTSWLLGCCLSYPACIHCCVATLIDHQSTISIGRQSGATLHCVSALCFVHSSFQCWHQLDHFAIRLALSFFVDVLSWATSSPSIQSNVGCVYVGWCLQAKAIFCLKYLFVYKQFISSHSPLTQPLKN